MSQKYCTRGRLSDPSRGLARIYVLLYRQRERRGKCYTSIATVTALDCLYAVIEYAPRVLIRFRSCCILRLSAVRDSFRAKFVRVLADLAISTARYVALAAYAAIPGP
jgi:hypothetical protein